MRHIWTAVWVGFADRNLSDKKKTKIEYKKPKIASKIKNKSEQIKKCRQRKFI